MDTYASPAPRGGLGQLQELPNALLLLRPLWPRTLSPQSRPQRLSVRLRGATAPPPPFSLLPPLKAGSAIEMIELDNYVTRRRKLNRINASLVNLCIQLEGPEQTLHSPLASSVGTTPALGKVIFEQRGELCDIWRERCY